MAAPNIASPSAVNGKTAHLALTNTAADVIAAVATGHVVHVSACFCANVTAAAHIVTVSHKAGGTSYRIAYQMSVAANSMIDVLDGRSLWLEEGDSLTALSDASSQIEINATYEDMS